MAPLLGRKFYERHHLDVARDLIGTTLVWRSTTGTVVETEAYAESGDPACHLYSRPSSRDFFATHLPGTAYVYLNYGVYWLLNVLTVDGIVLIRALDPTGGLALMRRRRQRSEPTDLCSGPGKLGVALALSRRDHGRCLTTDPLRGFVPRPPKTPPPKLATGPRIGISQGQELPWRFAASGNPHVSKPRI